ncbi:hypothetical protein TIFTF001_010492 [Ficus carica]|uniref:Uncharacterized protein n=1 Tax=Ficus carica TaxID=3494 RepID=A0AA87ZWJ6_FICCA|nr:hypothetical protein TIFTF001_010492 [Ficus carica]
MWAVHRRCQLASVPCLATVGRISCLQSIAHEVWESNHVGARVRNSETSSRHCITVQSKIEAELRNQTDSVQFEPPSFNLNSCPKRAHSVTTNLEDAIQFR